jgi:hypothetical protein
MTCNRKRDTVEYCFQCRDFPCEKHQKQSEKDSFISYKRVIDNLAKAQKDLPGYLSELNQRSAYLDILLNDYDDGRREGLFCLAANDFPLDALRDIIDNLQADARLNALDIKVKAQSAVQILEKKALDLGITLALRKTRTPQ